MKDFDLVWKGFSVSIWHLKCDGNAIWSKKEQINTHSCICIIIIIIILGLTPLLIKDRQIILDKLKMNNNEDQSWEWFIIWSHPGPGSSQTSEASHLASSRQAGEAAGHYGRRDYQHRGWSQPCPCHRHAVCYFVLEKTLRLARACHTWPHQ